MNTFFGWLVVLCANSIYFGAAVARYADGGKFDVIGILGSLLIGVSAGGGLSSHRRITKSEKP